MKKQPVTIFIKSQATSAIATLFDFGITILLKEVGSLWYLFSSAAGSIAGGIISFLLARRWVFSATDGSAGIQAMRYLLVWTGSIILNISGVFLLTSFGHLNYVLSKVLISLIVGIFFNYILQKKYVFNLRREIQ